MRVYKLVHEFCIYVIRDNIKNNLFKPYDIAGEHYNTALSFPCPYSSNSSSVSQSASLSPFGLALSLSPCRKLSRGWDNFELMVSILQFNQWIRYDKKSTTFGKIES